jgi:hypothetical protein
MKIISNLPGRRPKHVVRPGKFSVRGSQMIASNRHTMMIRVTVKIPEKKSSQPTVGTIKNREYSYYLIESNLASIDIIYYQK